MPGSIPAAVDDPVAGASVPDAEYIPTRTVGKTPRLPPHNPLQFVKVQSPLYIKAEQQIKLTKEVKICREALKEGEEEWQSNLDDWKSRRRKVSEKVIQRAEEMRQIEAEEQLRKDKVQRKIKKFSEIVEKKCSRSYHLDLYMGGGDDSGLGATPEPDDTLDTSEGAITSENESIDSDTHKIPEKEPPKVPQKPFAKFKRSTSLSYNNNEFFHPPKVLDLNSSTEPSDIEGHAADTEATSSEEDVGPIGVPDSLAEDASSQHDFMPRGTEEAWNKDGVSQNQLSNAYNLSFKMCIKVGDSRGFGFTLKGGKDQGCPAYIENVVKGSPAEEVGLKNGDRIISINGELTDEYSHASLVFSVKQALYTGILDIVIKRSDNCDIVNCDTKTIESRKGKSFAEKLAIFTAGVIAPSVDTKSKSGETKTESLVLRRRSAFENGNADNGNFVNRRLSCISQPPNTSSEKPLEKRHSVDFALGQYVSSDNTSNKKGPPPPIPAKPKFKTKTAFLELNKPVLKANETISSPPSSAETSSSSSPKESQPLDFVSLESEHQQTITDTKSVSENDADFSYETNSSFSKYEASEKTPYETELLMNVVGLNPNDYEFEPSGSNVTDEHSASFEVNAPELTETICNFNFFETLIDETDDGIDPNEFGEEMCNDSFEQDSDTIEVTDTFSNQLTNGVSSEHFDQRRSTQDPNDSLDNSAENISEEIDAEVTSTPSACHSAICNEDNDEDPFTQDDSEASDYKNNDINASLLGLSLEKIDEDDVISASTTTSSDTPDTETVIETLPSNVSPLPNDESNSEDFPKVLSAADEKPSGTSSSKILPSNETNDEQLTSQNYVETSEDCLEDYSNSVTHNMDKSYYDDQQNEDYAHELEESLDQITSLDIIDRIEQSLMDQLQKEDSYEDPWLYYSEESELIEDLTPRNLEPPREPPPPPPPPENDNKVMSISRTNSTKRIKKELLRRRSDFLGLQSPEVYQVDSIPPPPPLLEDLLKEQTQWLENRSEAPIGISSEPPSFESSSYSNNDYSDYFVEENVESPKEDNPEPWKSNMEEESVLDGNYGLQYVPDKPDSETVIGNAKQCESPQHKVKQNIQNLGAAPKAKIMDSTQWITDKEVAEPQISCHLNESRTSRRYSMPPLCSGTPPDVTVRTWGDRAYDYMQPRQTSATSNRPGIDNHHGNKDRHSLDLSYEAESEVHNCSCCGKGLCEGSAMGIEALRLYFHIECFRCCFCSIPLGNGSCGTDVQVKNNQLYCPSCFTVD